MRRNPRPRGGTTLIEALVAIVVIAAACAGLVPLLGQTVATMHETALREQELNEASATLDATVRWTMSDLEAHLGLTRTARNSIRVTPVAARLYEVEILDTAGRVSLLRTTLYRPGSVAQP